MNYKKAYPVVLYAQMINDLLIFNAYIKNSNSKSDPDPAQYYVLSNPISLPSTSVSNYHPISDFQVAHFQRQSPENSDSLPCFS
jgi:hypothetical protein